MTPSEQHARTNLSGVVQRNNTVTRMPDMVGLLILGVAANTQATLAVVEEIRALREEIKR